MPDDKFAQVANENENKAKEFFGFQADAKYGRAIEHIMKKYGLKKGQVLRTIIENDASIKQALVELEGEELAVND